VNDEESASASVVIPFYRDGDTIVRAVDSALGQNGGQIEVIVVAVERDHDRRGS
jgi:glycosyltransferase involved in cell wall biosynthesis